MKIEKNEHIYLESRCGDRQRFIRNVFQSLSRGECFLYLNRLDVNCVQPFCYVLVLLLFKTIY